MAQQYAIYNKVEACMYKSDKSYGAKDISLSHIYVGSSSKNSHLFVEPSTSKKIKYNEELGRNVCSFRFNVDGICIKEMLFEYNNGKAEALISSQSIIPSKGIV